MSGGGLVTKEQRMTYEKDWSGDPQNPLPRICGGRDPSTPRINALGRYFCMTFLLRSGKTVGTCIVYTCTILISHTAIWTRIQTMKYSLSARTSPGSTRSASPVEQPGHGKWATG